MWDDKALFSGVSIVGIVGAIWLFMLDVDHREAALECKEAGGIFFNPARDQICLHPSSVIRLNKDQLRQTNGSDALSRGSPR
jgi:hypothetical protein